MNTCSEDIENEPEEDEVIFETDVFLSKALHEKLYLFHYPSKTFSMVSDDQQILSTRIKPKQQKLEIELGLNVHSDNYDRSKGEQMAYHVDGQGATEEPYFNSSLMDKYVLFGSKATNTSDSYAIGLMKKGDLHITPLYSVMEINPEFVHMDKIDTASKKAQNLEEEEAEEEAVAVTVRFEGPNANKDRELREKSFQFLQQKNASEPWLSVGYHKIGSVPSMSELEKLVCPQMYGDTTCESVTPQDYLKDLVPDCLRLSGYQTEQEEETAIVKNEPLSDQINRLFVNAHLLSFSMLLEKLPPDIDVTSVERLVQKTAILVQGCWAVKSDLVYKKDSVSADSGVNFETLRTARDYVLWLFTKSRYITRKEVLSAVHIPDEDFRSMILPLAVKSGRGWEFKFPYDEDFVENHPTIAQSQDIKWNLMYKKIVKSLGVSESEGEKGPGPSRPRQKRPSRSSVSEGEEVGGGGEAVRRPATPKKPRPGPRPGRPLATLDVSPTPAGVTETQRAELRDYVGDAVRQQFCMTASEIRELLQEGHLSVLALREDFEEVLEDALAEYGAHRVRNKWPQNTTPESLFAYTKFGNKLDRYRQALLELFCATARTRPNLFVKKVEDELRERVSDNDCRQVFEEYCIYKSGFYYLKGTIAPDS